MTYYSVCVCVRVCVCACILIVGLAPKSSILVRMAMAVRTRVIRALAAPRADPCLRTTRSPVCGPVVCGCTAQAAQQVAPVAVHSVRYDKRTEHVPQLGLDETAKGGYYLHRVLHARTASIHMRIHIQLRGKQSWECRHGRICKLPSACTLYVRVRVCVCVCVPLTLVACSLSAIWLCSVTSIISRPLSSQSGTQPQTKL